MRKRNRKALGLALVAALALTAVGASSASAQLGKLTSDGAVTLWGIENIGPNAFTAFGSEVDCFASTHTGHKIQTTPHERLVSGATEITVKPHYNLCSNEEGDIITYDMNLCDLALKDPTTTGGVAGTYGILFDIDCGGGTGIQITGGPCTIRVPGQTNKTGLHATNGANKIRIHGTVHSLTAVACGLLHTTSAQQHMDFEFEGRNELGETTAVSFSD